MLNSLERRTIGERTGGLPSAGSLSSLPDVMENPPEKLRTGRVALALAVLVTGAAIGFALRGATSGRAEVSAEDVENTAAPPPSAALTASSAGGRERPLRSRSHARPPESVTLSAEQWAKVVAEPDRYALNIRKLRSRPVWEPLIATHANLFGWDDAVTAEVVNSVAAFNEKLLDLEKEKSDVIYTKPNPANQSMQLVVTYDRMSEDAEALAGELSEGLRNILGAKDAKRFATIANLSSLPGERNNSIRDELVVQTSGERALIQQTLSGSANRMATMIYPFESLAVVGPTFTSAAVDWDRILSSILPTAPASE